MGFVLHPWCLEKLLMIIDLFWHWLIAVKSFLWTLFLLLLQGYIWHVSVLTSNAPLLHIIRPMKKKAGGYFQQSMWSIQSIPCQHLGPWCWVEPRHTPISLPTKKGFSRLFQYWKCFSRGWLGVCRISKAEK